MKKLSLYIACLLCLLTACEPDTECRQEENVRLKVTFLCDSVNAEGEKVTFTSIDSLTLQGVGSDSILRNNDKNVSSLSLPLRKDTTLTQFAVTFNNVPDTLTVRHTNNQQFISLACGCFVYHTVEEVTHTTHIIDSVLIVNAAVENYEQNNLQLYLSF